MCMTPTVHTLDADYAYAETQTSDAIKDGDVLVIETRELRMVAVMMAAWPVAIVFPGDVPPCGFHTLAPDADITCIGKRDERRDWITIHPRKYIVTLNGADVSEHDSPMAAEDAARAIRGGVRYEDLEPYRHEEIWPANPGTDYTDSIALARATAEELDTLRH